MIVFRKEKKNLFYDKKIRNHYKCTEHMLRYCVSIYNSTHSLHTYVFWPNYSIITRFFQTASTWNSPSTRIMVHISLPILKNHFDVMDLVPQPDTTIRMHCRHHIQILAGLTKPAKVSRVQEPDLQPDLRDKRVEFDHVEHILIVFPREIIFCGVPELVELDSPIVWSNVGEPSVRIVAQVRGIVFVHIARDLEVAIRVESWKWIP